MKWLRAIVFSVIAIMVSGQASLQFTKPGATKDEFEHDKKYCIAEAVGAQPEQASEGDTTGKEPVLLEGIKLTAAEHRLALACMHEKGYRLRAPLEE